MEFTAGSAAVGLSAMPVGLVVGCAFPIVAVTFCYGAITWYLASEPPVDFSSRSADSAADGAARKHVVVEDDDFPAPRALNVLQAPLLHDSDGADSGDGSPAPTRGVLHLGSASPPRTGGFLIGSADHSAAGSPIRLAHLSPVSARTPAFADQSSSRLGYSAMLSIAGRSGMADDGRGAALGVPLSNPFDRLRERQARAESAASQERALYDVYHGVDGRTAPSPPHHDAHYRSL